LGIIPEGGKVDGGTARATTHTKGIATRTRPSLLLLLLLGKLQVM
jgi:hypothetical protein